MGIVAVGDSLVNAELSWAHWLGRAMDQPLDRVSADGARSAGVREQVRLLEGHQYDVACLTVGTNDILFDWDPGEFADNLAAIVDAAKGSAERVVVPTISLGLASFPGSGAVFRRRVRQANAVLDESGALVFAGDDLRGPRLMGPDRIHPTLVGQLVLADRAAELLGVAPSPSSLVARDRAPGWSSYYRVTAGQVPRRIVKRALGRPMYRLPEE
ncbi:MAG: SGNH/GDSL hydrolase family protein [Actinomycetota bacterium]|nr:SGNH/GDSL hydrolase family protein [Actinomycetota bacterium]